MCARRERSYGFSERRRTDSDYKANPTYLNLSTKIKPMFHITSWL